MLDFIEPNIHPFLVHFAYALTIVSVLCFWLSGFENRSKGGLKATANWTLAFAAFAIIGTILAGFQAYYSVNHDGPSHVAMTTHRNWAVPSGAAILILAIWRFIQRRNRAGFVFKSMLTIAAMALSVTAWWGGHIVYNYGLGVASLPAVTGDGHDHEHADGAGHETPSAVTAPAHDDNDGHHDAEPVAAIVPHGHDNSDGHHNTPIAAVPKGHDNSDGHHDHDAMSEDDRAIRAIIADVEMGWEQGDGSPFRSHFKDYDGARYFESGGENKGLEDLVVNHVEPEKTSIPDLKLGLSNIQIHYQGANMAWAVGDSTVQGTIVKNGTVLDRTGKQTWIFEKIDGAWKIVHTHSSSRAAKK